MAQTDRGITYPESDAHTRLWEHLQALAETSDAAITAAITAAATPDTGWKTVPYASGWTTSGGNPLSVRKIGKVVYVRGRVTATSGTIPVTNGTTIANLPAGFMPGSASAIFSVPTQNPPQTSCRIFFNTSGSISLYTYTNPVPYVSVDVSYVAA